MVASNASEPLDPTRAEAPITRALLSVFDKEGLLPFAQGLVQAGVVLLASGGTARALAEAGIPFTGVDAHTGAPEVLGGRVKTLHPRIHGGILADRRRASHHDQLREHDIPPVDMVVCNLYPFEQALRQGSDTNDQIEMIDIGGPTLIRAAAKNVLGGVTVVTDPDDYTPVLQALQQGDGQVPLSTRWRLAAKAFAVIARYDQCISDWTTNQARAVFAADDIATAQAGSSSSPSTSGSTDAQAQAASTDVSDNGLPQTLPGFHKANTLRYGENPQQVASLYLADGELQGVARGKQLAGKALSYNNYLDLDAAYRAACLLHVHGCAIVKHTNPCGMAQASDQADAFARALAGDPVSAFGGIIGFNQPVTLATAEAIRQSKVFVECIVAPGFAPEVLEAFAKRPNLRLVTVPPGDPAPNYHAHRIGGGMLVQEVDSGVNDPAGWVCVTDKQPEAGWRDELAFAMRCAAVLKSNAITITRGMALQGAGAGQMSRVDATEQAIKKAGEGDKQGCTGGFMGSDAFFPFGDCVRLAANAGVVAVVQPGGSKRDDESIAACNELGLVMLFTGQRHFRH